MIRLRAVTHRFNNGHKILTDCAVEIPSGRRIAMLSLPSSGKTTVMQLLSRQITPWRGTIERSVKVSFVGGFHTAFRPTLTARHNIEFAARLYGADPSSVFGFIREISGLGAKLDIPFRQVSLQNRISLAYLLAYALDFDMYLFDNMVGPMVSEIANFRGICEELYARKTANGGAVIATRDVRVAARYCDSGLLLRDRKLWFYEDLADAIAIHEQDCLIAQEQEPRTDFPGDQRELGIDA